jgi:hypothetical protein
MSCPALLSEVVRKTTSFSYTPNSRRKAGSRDLTAG